MIVLALASARALMSSASASPRARSRRPHTPGLDVWLAVRTDVWRSPVVGRVVAALAETFGREARALTR